MDDTAKAGRWPLAGVRILDFTWAWAGPHMTRLLGDLGAEVIKVESSVRYDGIRLQGATYVEDGYRLPPEATINRSGNFNQLNRNKRSCLLNLQDPRGLDLARRLVAISDVVASNFTPGVMERFGLGYEDLRAIKPDIIVAQLSGYGQTGPESRFVTYGPPMTYLSGIASVTGYEDDGLPRMLGSTYCDGVGGGHGAFAVLAALHHRDRTGEGQAIDISMWEAAINMIPEAVLEYTFNDRQRPIQGNRDDAMSPHGCYPCAGEDKWVAIAVRDERDWQELARAVGRPEWAEDARLQSLDGRRARAAEIDEAIAAWTRQYAPLEAARALQAVGVPAGPSYNAPEMMADDNLRHREFFVVDDHPEAPGKVLNGVPFRVSGMPRAWRRHAPLLGQDTEYVYRDLLGLSAEEYEQLLSEDVIK